MIRVHQDANNDLRGIHAKDRGAAGKLVALIEQLRKDPQLKSKLLEHEFGEDRVEPISVKKWVTGSRESRKPIWRLKAWDMERQGLKYRIIYIYRWRDQSYTILAVVPRDGFDYDNPSHPIRQRVLERVRTEFGDA